MRPSLVLLTPLLVVQASAQSTSQDLLSIIASQAFSIFTSLTSVIGNTPTTSPTRSSASPTTSDDSESLFPPLTSSLASVTSASTRARPSSTSSLSSPTTSASSGSTAQVTPSPTSSLVNTSNASRSGTAAAASATSAAPASGGSNHDRNLAIILGTVLGALALGLFILLLLLLCRRRRRRAHTAQSASLTSNSDEALATHHKTPRSRTTPLAAVFASRKSRNHRRGSNGGAPLMSERSAYDVPSAHEFGHADTVPFVPESGDARRSSGILPTASHSSVNTRGGLNSHPYSDNHHTGTAVAAGAGGAALGAAAARRASRSSERRYEHRTSGDPEVHPAFWDEPPPRSPHRNSMDSSMNRRSGSMPRTTFRGPQDHSGSPLRSGAAAAAAGGVAGAAAGTVADRSNRRSHERGRSISTNPPPYDASYNGSAPVPSGGLPNTAISGNQNATPVVAEQGHSDLNGHRRMAPALGGAALGAGVASQSRSRSRPRSYPPLPPSIVIPDTNQRRNLPSRSPKRTRFGTDTYHEPMPYENERLSQNTVSPPMADHNNAWNSIGSPALADTPITNDLVSPISPEDTTRNFGHSRPTTSTRANAVPMPRSRSISPNITSRHSNPFMTNNLPISPPTTDSNSTPVNGNTTPDTRPSRAPRQNSGLVNAVKDHFNPNSTQSQTHPPAYTAYKPPGSTHPSAFPAEDPPISNRAPRPIPRKPVAAHGYSGDDTWRGQEDSAWAQSYSTPTRLSNDGIGQAR